MFSDIDGSTRLLSRLGPAYADAMDAQRRLMRRATNAHGGIEMGTEGDSFFVAFRTAPAAVAAASEAQLQLESYSWPEGERVRVRMGIHTGSPTVHHGGYIGMDVHRAARIASAAHGGQIVISDSTAHLVAGGGLPDGVQLCDLGTHRLKDLPAPERLFQLRLPGLQVEFAPLKSLGAGSSLPATTTPFIGRDKYLAELLDLLGSRQARLVTLTGPGGSGKTRLAIELAQRLTGAFPDGVYFVPLAATTLDEAMYRSIAEALDLPPEARTTHTLMEHLAHRSALMVLDNLEQLVGADEVVAELLDRARQMVFVATSRSPLHLQGECEYAVEPLSLPHGDGLVEVAGSFAAQLFIQHAGNVLSRFTLTDANAPDVAAICRRLDGLPLAIELAAARTKLLSPHALLGRLDRALDLPAAGHQGPVRQRTLRDTIAWSYNLLPPNLQKLFRWLGAFSGSADLEAIGEVMRADDQLRDEDPLDLVARLVDASLVTVSEAADGEPRIGILKTMRAFAIDQLKAVGEFDPAHAAHARHYLGIAGELSGLIRGAQERSARLRFEAEVDNFQEALEWATGLATPNDIGIDGPTLGLQMASRLALLWFASSHFSRERYWMARVVERASGNDGAELASCLEQLGRLHYIAGELPAGHESTSSSIAMWRRLAGEPVGLASALETLGNIEVAMRRPEAGRSLIEEAIDVAETLGQPAELCSARLSLAIVVSDFDGDYATACEIERQAVDAALVLGNPSVISRAQHNMACSLRQLGRTQEANVEMRRLIARTLDLGRPMRACEIAEDYTAVLVDLGEYAEAVTLLAASEESRRLIGVPRPSYQANELAEPIGRARAALSAGEWQEADRRGRAMTVDEALAPHALKSTDAPPYE